MQTLILFDYTGITQDDIDTARSAQERYIMEEVTSKYEKGDDLSERDQQGATLVSKLDYIYVQINRHNMVAFLILITLEAL